MGLGRVRQHQVWSELGCSRVSRLKLPESHRVQAFNKTNHFNAFRILQGFIVWRHAFLLSIPNRIASDDTADYAPREVKANLLSCDTRASDRDRVSSLDVWKQSKKMYDRTQMALNGGEFPITGDAHELFPLLRIIFRIKLNVKTPNFFSQTAPCRQN